MDALLAASAYCDNISAIFIGDGVYQLMQGQQVDGILSKDYSPMFKLFELYDIEQVYVCEASLSERGLQACDLIIDVTELQRPQLSEQLHQADKILTF